MCGYIRRLLIGYYYGNILIWIIIHFALPPFITHFALPPQNPPTRDFSVEGKNTKINYKAYFDLQPSTRVFPYSNISCEVAVIP